MSVDCSELFPDDIGNILDEFDRDYDRQLNKVSSAFVTPTLSSLNQAMQIRDRF